MSAEKFHVYLERKIGGYSLLSTARATQWNKRTAAKHAKDVNQWIDEGRGHWARNYYRAEVVSVNGEQTHPPIYIYCHCANLQRWRLDRYA